MLFKCFIFYFSTNIFTLGRYQLSLWEGPEGWYVSLVFKLLVINQRIQYSLVAYLGTIVGFTCRTYQRRDLLNRLYASDGARQDAIERAEQVESSLGSDFPTFLKPMLQSHVTGGFWLVSFRPVQTKQMTFRNKTLLSVICSSQASCSSLFLRFS